MNINGFGKATEISIDVLQNQIGFQLPKDYISFLMQYNGGIFKEAQFLVSDLNEKIQLHTLYGIKVNNDFDLKSWNDEYQDDLLPNSIIIGHDYGGVGFIVLMVQEKNKGIYFWDHTFHFEQSSEQSNTYFITSSFADFINMLKNQS